MTDHLSISKQLALAIGWNKNQMIVGHKLLLPCYQQTTPWLACSHREFDYRDEVVAFRVAQRYDCFPYAITDKGARTGQWNAITRGKDNIADTPQLAIALAVVGANK